MVFQNSQHYTTVLSNKIIFIFIFIIKNPIVIMIHIYYVPPWAQQTSPNRDVKHGFKELTNKSKPSSSTCSTLALHSAIQYNTIQYKSNLLCIILFVKKLENVGKEKGCELICVCGLTFFCFVKRLTITDYI